jgi:hypothetical protein
MECVRQSCYAVLLGAEAAPHEALGYQTCPTVRADYECIVTAVRSYDIETWRAHAKFKRDCPVSSTGKSPS